MKLIDEWAGDGQGRCTARATSATQPDGAAVWAMTVLGPTAGGKYVATVEHEGQPAEFLMNGPFETRTGGKRWANEQALGLVSAAELEGGTL